MVACVPVNVCVCVLPLPIYPVFVLTLIEWVCAIEVEPESNAVLLAVFPLAAPVFPVAAPVVPLIYRSAVFPDVLDPYESTGHDVPPYASDAQKPAFWLGT